MHKEISLQSGINGIGKFNKASFFIYILLIPSLIAYHALDRAKFIYFLPLIMIILPLIQSIVAKKTEERNIFIDRNMLFALGLYILIAGLSISLNFDRVEYSTLIRDVLILLSPLIVFSTKLEFNDKHITWLFIAVIISYFAWVGFQLELGLSFNLIRSNYNLASEFHNGVIIGGFFLFFIYRKKFTWAIVAAFLILLSGKRSIFLGVFPALFVYYGFIKPLKLESSKSLLFVFLFLYFIILYFIGINFVSFSNWFLDVTNLDRQVDLDRFLMGREVLITYLRNGIQESELLQYLFGNGPGQADVYLLENARPDWMIGNGVSVNPHNDFLKLGFDYGLVGSILFFLIFYASYIKGNVMGIQMFLYTMPLFLVDNSFIFIYYWFIALAISRYKTSEGLAKSN